MALNPVLRPGVTADSSELEAIERDSFPGPNWTAKQILQYDCVIAEVNSAIAGFIVSRETFAGSAAEKAEREILNLAVAARFPAAWACQLVAASRGRARRRSVPGSSRIKLGGAELVRKARFP